MSVTTRVGKGAILPRSRGGDAAVFIRHGCINRTDTADKNLFRIPAALVPIAVIVTSPAASNAGSTAAISLGKTGTPTHFVNAFDVKGAGGTGRQFPTAGNLNAAVGANEIQVTGRYAETGTPSTVGGGWNVLVVLVDAP